MDIDYAELRALVESGLNHRHVAGCYLSGAVTPACPWFHADRLAFDVVPELLRRIDSATEMLELAMAVALPFKPNKMMLGLQAVHMALNPKALASASEVE